ncbi:MAG: DUF1428 family protein [Limnochordaceae bacterium]|nr:DUF1428 family protein [Limnochordaceae bacterium]
MEVAELCGAIYICRVPRARVDPFLRIQQEAAELYKTHGALDDITWTPADLAPKYGCIGFQDALSPGGDEVILVGISIFRDRAYHDEVMARVDADERIVTLYRELTQLIDVSKVVRGEFDRAI